MLPNCRNSGTDPPQLRRLAANIRVDHAREEFMSGKFQMVKPIVLIAIALAYGTVASAKATLVGIDDVKGGSLLFATKTPGRHIQAPLLATDVDISVSGPIALSCVRRRNPVAVMTNWRSRSTGAPGEHPVSHGRGLSAWSAARRPHRPGMSAPAGQSNHRAFRAASFDRQICGC